MLSSQALTDIAGFANGYSAASRAIFCSLPTAARSSLIDRHVKRLELHEGPTPYRDVLFLPARYRQLCQPRSAANTIAGEGSLLSDQWPVFAIGEIRPMTVPGSITSFLAASITSFPAAGAVSS